MVSPDLPSFWDEQYRSDRTGWDMQTHTPVFEKLLNEQRFIKPGKILIAGCGKGYDAVLAARKGYDVHAVDFSAEAIKIASALAEKENVKVNFINKDIFELGTDYRNFFDYVYDYVTFCAILPGRREEYALNISDYLKPGGELIALLFPVEKREGGPPFAVDVVEFYDLFSRHLQLKFSTRNIDSIKPRKGREVLQIYMKKEEIDKDADKS